MDASGPWSKYCSAKNLILQRAPKMVKCCLSTVQMNKRKVLKNNKK